MKTVEKLKAKAKAAVKKEITKQKAAMKARKVAWKRAADGHQYRSIGDGKYVHVIGSKAYVANKSLTTAERITGKDAAKEIKSAKAMAVVREAKEKSKEIKRAGARSKAAAAVRSTPKKAAPKRVSSVGGMVWRGY